MAGNEDSISIYFTDFFGVKEETLAEHGALDISLINDLPLFIDPFLLFDSEDDEYRRLHEHIIDYVKFLRDVAVADGGTRARRAEWFTFGEVRQNWLGFSKTGNHGSGLGSDFAATLWTNLRGGFKNFGEEGVSRSHLEKLCLLDRGVGRDHLSDFATNLIKGFLLRYTQEFAKANIDPTLCREFAIKKVWFDFGSGRWRGDRFFLPAHEGDHVILTPRDILTKDEAWINRGDMLDRFSDIFPSIDDEQLRDQVNDYFVKRLTEDAGKQDRRKVAMGAAEAFPGVLDYYIRLKEQDAPEAHRESAERVQETERLFIVQLKELVSRFLAGTEFYKQGGSFREALARINFLKSAIEDKDGWRLFYIDGKPVKREVDLQLMYRLTWFASPYSADREVNNGRGPVDFKVSMGSADATLVEFKLASNSKLRQNLKHQVGVYEKANDTASSIKAIMCFDEVEIDKVQTILRELGLTGRPDVVIIDASPNKPSASNVVDG